MLKVNALKLTTIAENEQGAILALFLSGAGEKEVLKIKNGEIVNTKHSRITVFDFKVKLQLSSGKSFIFPFLP